MPERLLRIAWIGGPSLGGGVGGFCRQLINSLLEAGLDLTVFSSNTLDDFDEIMGSNGKRATLISHPPAWEWNRWYSRHPLPTFISSFWSRRRSYSHIVRAMRLAHKLKPFDAIVQFSQIELFELRKHLHELPPVLLFPCVHAAGELRWHRRESVMALRTESRLRHYLVRANLMQRALLQKKCCNSVYGVIGMSHRFNELLSIDYGVKPENQTVLYQPIDLVPTCSKPATDESVGQDSVSNDGRLKLLFVGRISVRKGLEMLVELSQRLDDVADKVSITILGGASFWSDYTNVLEDLNPRVAKFIGAKSHAEVFQWMVDSDVLLVPSHYEPGGIVVAEALERGTIIVASDEVGSAEPLPDTVCRKFRSGNMDEFEAQVRRLIAELPTQRHPMRETAMRTARETFAPEKLQSKLLRILETTAARKPIGSVE